MLNERERQLNTTLQALAESLDIPPAKFAQARERYGAVGLWLEDGEYDGCTDSPRVEPQGSFRLGTVVRPLRNGKEADYDIDLVCELQQLKDKCTPSGVKTAVGDRLKQNGNYSRMLDPEGRRCWTLNYAEEDGIGFHMDILPSVPDPDAAMHAGSIHGVPFEFAQHTLAITEKHKGTGAYSWKEGGSNPAGYAKWFDGRNRAAFSLIEGQQKRAILEGHRAIFASISDVPDALVRTPLQRAIQILKRHRDMRFLGHQWEKEKPISIIITTLAALAYQNESDVYTALMGIVGRLERYASLLNGGQPLTEDLRARLIEKREGQWYLPNPVNPGENFTDRWNDQDSHRAKAFFQWLGWVKSDLQKAIAATGIPEARLALTPVFGKQAVENALPKSSPPEPEAKAFPTILITQPSKPWQPDGTRPTT